MTNLRKKLFCYTGIALLCVIGITTFFSYRSTKNSSTTVSSNRNYDRASLIPTISNLSSLISSKNPSYATSIRRNSKYHDVIDTFKTITGYISIINNAFPRLQILILFNNFLQKKFQMPSQLIPE